MNYSKLGRVKKDSNILSDERNLRTRTIDSSAFNFNQIRDCLLPVVLEIILIIFALSNCKTKKNFN